MTIVALCSARLRTETEIESMLASELDRLRASLSSMSRQTKAALLMKSGAKDEAEYLSRAENRLMQVLAQEEAEARQIM